MNVGKFEQELTVNRAAYDEQKARIERDYAGKYVALAHGRVVAATTSFDDAVRAVEHVVPKPEHCVVFMAGEEPEFEPYDAWHTTYLEDE